MTAHTEWTPDRIEQLTALWASGLPTLQIATELGLTKNAVIGKANRIGLTPRPRHNPLSVRRPARVARIPIPAPDTTNRCSIFELTATKCRWPINGPGEPFAACGSKAVKTYCPYHAHVGTARRRAA